MERELMNRELPENEPEDKRPSNSRPLFLGPGVQIEGDVRFGDEVSVWHNAVIWADSAPVSIDSGSNVQDLCVIHTDPGFPVRIGRHVTLGHGAIVHGAVIEDDCLIGMGAIVMNGAHIEKGAIVAAGALIPEGKTVPAGHLAAGLPARIIRPLKKDELEATQTNARHYVEQARARVNGTGQPAF